MEHLVTDLEQYSRKQNVIVTGLNMHSYAQPPAPDLRERPLLTEMTSECPPLTEMTSVSRQLRNLPKFTKEKLNISLAEIEITAIHDLRKCRDGTMPLIAQFLPTNKTTELMCKRKVLNGTNVYLNIHSTQNNNEIFAEAQERTLDLRHMNDELQHLWEED